VLLLSAGNTDDITMAHALIEAAGPFRKLLDDRGYDADHLRMRVAERSAEAVIPTTTSRERPIPYDILAYRQRNTVGSGPASKTRASTGAHQSSGRSVKPSISWKSERRQACAPQRWGKQIGPVAGSGKAE
jgi:transposase